MQAVRWISWLYSILINELFWPVAFQKKTAYILVLVNETGYFDQSKVKPPVPLLNVMKPKYEVKPDDYRYNWKKVSYWVRNSNLIFALSEFKTIELLQNVNI